MAQEEHRGDQEADDRDRERHEPEEDGSEIGRWPELDEALADGDEPDDDGAGGEQERGDREAGDAIGKVRRPRVLPRRAIDRRAGRLDRLLIRDGLGHRSNPPAPMIAVPSPWPASLGAPRATPDEPVSRGPERGRVDRAGEHPRTAPPVEVAASGPPPRPRRRRPGGRAADPGVAIAVSGTSPRSMRSPSASSRASIGQRPPAAGPDQDRDPEPLGERPRHRPTWSASDVGQGDRPDRAAELRRQGDRAIERRDRSGRPGRRARRRAARRGRR